MSSQAYLFAHDAIPSLTFADPSRMLGVLAGSAGQQFLLDMWETAGRHCDPDKKAEPEGLEYSLTPTGTTGVVAAIRLPKPREIPEAYFVAIFGRFASPEDPHLGDLKWSRVFTLELADHPMTGVTCTMLCEWTHEGKHLNYGEGPPPEEELFVESAVEILWKEKERMEQEQAKQESGEPEAN